jgi:hypothetical protein
MRIILINEVDSLIDDTKYYNVVIYGQVECHCETLAKAVKLQSALLEAISKYSILISAPALLKGRCVA